jgi:hypothetical protein
MVQDKGRTMTLYLVVDTDVFTLGVRYAVPSRDMVLERSVPLDLLLHPITIAWTHLPRDCSWSSQPHLR